MFYRCAKSLFWLYFTLFRRWLVTGRENVPAGGPLIVVANHSSYWDPIVVGVVLPRPVVFMAKVELFQGWPLGPVIRGLGAFPVRRGQGDRRALRRSLEVLRQGGVLGIFPEGGRNRTGQPLAPLQEGAAFLAARTGTPVLPVALAGVREALVRFSRSPLRVVIGEPVRPRPGETAGELSSRLASTFRALLGASG